MSPHCEDANTALKVNRMCNHNPNDHALGRVISLAASSKWNGTCKIINVTEKIEGAFSRSQLRAT